MPLFDKKSDKLIKRGMKKWKNRHNRFVRISKLIPKYTPKQIASHWKNYLDPNLCPDSLDSEEKNFIVEWIQRHKTSNSVVHWKYLVHDLKDQFGKQHSENKVKNFWNSRRKCHLRKVKRQENGVEEQRTIHEEREQEQTREISSDDDEQDVQEKQGKVNEHNFVLRFISSDDSFLKKNGYTKITISSLLNFDNNL